jgi:hypothetical protein
MSHNFGFDLETIKAVLVRKYLKAGHVLVGYEVKKKKPNEMRSNWDSSKHLIIFFLDDEKELCRMVASHNNNQHLKIDDPLKWYEAGFEKCADMTTVNQESHLHWSKV